MHIRIPIYLSILYEEFRHVLTFNVINAWTDPSQESGVPIWQRRMEAILQGLTNVVSFFDDVIVFAKNFEEMLSALNATLERMQQNGLRPNRSKCIFAVTSLECLGHRIDRNGLHKSDQHIAAIRDAPKPTTAGELQLFLGKAAYHSSFIPILSCRARPLRDMLLSNSFMWTKEADKAYQDIKLALISPKVLMPYDSTLPLILATDASKTGLGAVLSHRLSNGSERPIAYASCTVSQSKKRYPMIDKEARAPRCNTTFSVQSNNRRFACCSYRNRQNEWISSFLCLLARNRCRNRTSYKILYIMR
uniref:RNA-directed DNA polymerase n=1 Tax=Anopheles stephensi TaxID=30069 RepID=A0A182YR42_ANOST